MNIQYSKQFIKDSKKYPQYKALLRESIHSFQNASSLSDIPNIKKLHSPNDDYRLRLGNFRVGFSKIGDTIIFKRFLHRKDIYRYFP